MKATVTQISALYNRAEHQMISECNVFLLDLVAQRGEKLELLIDKTENLVDSVSVCLDSRILPFCRT